jgi:hypothetical protein
VTTSCSPHSDAARNCRSPRTRSQRVSSARRPCRADCFHLRLASARPTRAANPPPQRRRKLYFDDVSLERRVQPGAIPDRDIFSRSSAAIGVLDVKDDLALPQVLALEGVVGRSLVSHAQAAAVASNRQRPFRVERPEARAAAAEGSERGVEGVGEPSRGGTDRQRREQGHDLLVGSPARRPPARSHRSGCPPFCARARLPVDDVQS